MTNRYRLILSTLTGVVMLPLWCYAATPILTEVPPEDAIRSGQVIYVDDGQCPAGEVKEITGGNRDKGIKRRIRCVDKLKAASGR